MLSQFPRNNLLCTIVQVLASCNQIDFMAPQIKMVKRSDIARVPKSYNDCYVPCVGVNAIDCMVARIMPG